MKRKRINYSKLPERELINLMEGGDEGAVLYANRKYRSSKTKKARRQQKP